MCSRVEDFWVSVFYFSYFSIISSYPCTVVPQRAEYCFSISIFFTLGSRTNGFDEALSRSALCNIVSSEMQNAALGSASARKAALVDAQSYSHCESGHPRLRARSGSTDFVLVEDPSRHRGDSWPSQDGVRGTAYVLTSNNTQAPLCTHSIPPCRIFVAHPAPYRLIPPQ